MKTLLFVMLLLAACGEIDQSKSAATTSRGDQPAFKGGVAAYQAKGWTPGDKVSWDNQVRARGQNQNEYPKTSQ
ncbi:MAG: hypothetical protein V4463_08735 [Pseudomonadota bacterium]